MKRRVCLFIFSFFLFFFLAYPVVASNIGGVLEKTNQIQKNENILFVGDSILDWYPTDLIFDDLPVVNSAVSGNKTYDILNDLEKRIYQYNPTKVFLLIGTNDLDREDSDEINQEVYENIVSIAEKTRAHRFQSKIYLISIFPVNNHLPYASLRHASEIKSINSMLEEFSFRTSNVEYVNAFDALKDEEDMLREEYTKDGLHLNDLGYAKLTEILMKYIYE